MSSKFNIDKFIFNEGILSRVGTDGNAMALVDWGIPFGGKHWKRFVLRSGWNYEAYIGVIGLYPKEFASVSNSFLGKTDTSWAYYL